MIVEFSVVDTKDFTIEHLFDSPENQDLIANFAINKLYKDSHPEAQKLGLYTFKKFVLPIVQRMSVYVGVSALYIYALPEEKLIEHYHTMGFSRLPEHQEKFVQLHVKPKYDEGCIFMYQVI